MVELQVPHLGGPCKLPLLLAWEINYSGFAV